MKKSSGPKHIQIKAQDVKPEIVAVIAASVYEVMGTSNLAIRIKRTSSTWAITGRQKLMDVRQTV